VAFSSIQSPLSQRRRAICRLDARYASNHPTYRTRNIERYAWPLDRMQFSKIGKPIAECTLGVCGRLSPTNYEPQYWLSWCYWYGPCISSRAASIRCRVPSIFHCVHLPLHTAAHLSVGSLCYCEAVELRGGAGRGRAASGDELSSWTLRCQRGTLPKNACGRAHKCDTTEDCLLYKKAGG
jgi:hypothetical protein